MTLSYREPVGGMPCDIQKLTGDFDGLKAVIDGLLYNPDGSAKVGPNARRAPFTSPTGDWMVEAFRGHDAVTGPRWHLSILPRLTV